MAQNSAPMQNSRFVNSSVSELEQENSRRTVRFQDLPIKPLNDTLQEIVRLIPEVITCAENARKYCKQNDPLTIDELLAIRLYTMDNINQKLNEALRHQSSHELQPWLAFLRLFVNALGKIDSCPATVWRGVAGVIGSDFDKGTIHTWFSVNSCTVDLPVAEMFVGNSGTLFCIETKNGKNIAEYSSKPHEKEIVLMPGVRLRVKDRSVGTNVAYIVHLEEW